MDGRVILDHPATWRYVEQIQKPLATVTAFLTRGSAEVHREQTLMTDHPEFDPFDHARFTFPAEEPEIF